MKVLAPPTREALRDHLSGWHEVNYAKTRNVAAIPLADWHAIDHRTNFTHGAADLSAAPEGESL